MRYPVLTDEQLDEEIKPVLKGLRLGPILRDFFLHWATLGAFIGFGSVWASEKTWAAFHPSSAWIFSVILGSGIAAAGPVLLRIWAIRRYLTRTNAELREQVEKDWSILTRRGWVGRLVRFSLAAAVLVGTSTGLLLSILFPEERFLESTLATIGVVTGMFLVPLVPMVFGGRALLIGKLKRRVEGTLLPKEDPSSDQV